MSGVRDGDVVGDPAGPDPAGPDFARPDFAGTVALVTGGGSGIGAACARRLAGAGAAVLVADLDLAAARAVAGELPGDALAVAVDVADPDSADAMVAAAVAQWGRLDVAVNNAGIGQSSAKPLGELDTESWRRTLAVNLDGVFFCLRAEIGAMLAGGRGGSVVNMASVMGAVAAPGAGSYVAAKHGVVGLTRAAAVEYAAAGVRVNAVGPGFIDTPLLRSGLPEAAISTVERAHPVGRLGTAEEVARVVCWLADPAATFVTGGYYPVDGGYLAR